MRKLQSPYLEFTRPAMATDFVLQMNMGQYSADKSSALDALDIVSSLERELSYFLAESVIGRLNREEAHIPVFPDAPVYELFKLCRDLYSQTSGAFDISAGRLWEIWGFARREGRIPDESEIASALQEQGIDKLEFNDAAASLARGNSQVKFNLGAIGKGYALDRAGRFLLDCGIGDFLFHGGKSSVMAVGNRSEEIGWQIGLHNPMRNSQQRQDDSTRIKTIRLQNQALATSGTQTQFFRFQGKRYGHIIDPRTGYPAGIQPETSKPENAICAPAVYSATVIVPINSAETGFDTFAASKADALATAFYILGPSAAEKYCKQNQGVEIIFVLPDNTSTIPFKLLHTGEKKCN